MMKPPMATLSPVNTSMRVEIASRRAGFTAAALVRLKVAAPRPAWAKTVYAPAVPLAVKAGAVAKPLASVTTSANCAAPGNVPEAPTAGAEKCTAAPTSGAPRRVSCTCSAMAKGVPTVALCGVPAVDITTAQAFASST